MRSVGNTCTPISATWPLTFTQPWAIQSSASRREHRPSSAMRLFRRELTMPFTVIVADARSGACLMGATNEPDAVR